MIVAIQYSIPNKVAFGTKSQTLNSARVAELVNLDPTTTDVEAIILGPKDLSGLSSKKLIAALENKHPDLQVIYIYTKPKEAVDLDVDMHTFLVKKVNADEIKEAVEQVYNKVGVREDNVTDIDDDLEDYEDKPDEEVEVPDVVVPEQRTGSSDRRERRPRPVRSQTAKLEDAVSQELETAVKILEETENEEVKIKMPESVITFEELQGTTAEPSIEDRVQSMESIKDWDQFKNAIERDSIIKELLKESNDFSGAINMLEVLDRQIQVVFTDTAKSSGEKLQEIRHIALQRASYKDIGNNIITDKLCKIMESIVTTTQRTVDTELDKIRKNMEEVAKSEIMFGQREKLQELIKERLEIQLKLHELINAIVNVYRTVDGAGVDVIHEFDKELPSRNEFINEMLSAQRGLYTPQSAGLLANRIMADLSRHQISLSSLENQVSEVVAMVFRLCDIDAGVIAHQDKYIRLLESRRIEEIVVTDTLLKTSLNLYVGREGTGLHATALTWSGILSRRRNTLVIDLTGKSKYEVYGFGSIALSDFLNTRAEKQLLTVDGILTDKEAIAAFVLKLNEITNYYNHINVILSTEQSELINELSEHALTINYVVNSTRESIDSVASVNENNPVTNIAKKVVLIDAVDTSWTLDRLKVDPLATKVIQVPHMQAIREAALRQIRPCDSEEVAVVFERVFR